MPPVCFSFPFKIAQILQDSFKDLSIDFILRFIDLFKFKCDKTIYLTKSSAAYYPTKTYLRSLLTIPKVIKLLGNASETRDAIETSFLKVNVFYSSLSYLSVTENPSITIYTLLSSMGGALGLFLGMSILSFIEGFEILIEFIYACFETRRQEITTTVTTKI